LFGVWQSGALVAFAYIVLDGNTWEFGGLATAESVQGSGIGTLLTRFALAHNIAYEEPFSNGQEIIAHVHESNQKPRNILTRVGFQIVKPPIDVTDVAPDSMKRNASGRVVGDRFRFTKEGLMGLADWFNKDFDGTLGRGRGAIIFDLGPANLDDLKEALRQIAESSVSM
jgi:FR47-like protein